jgi:hypothetical protein
MRIFKVTFRQAITRTVCLPAENEEGAEKEALALGQHQGPAFVRTQPRPFPPEIVNEESKLTLLEIKELPPDYRPGSSN